MPSLNDRSGSTASEKEGVASLIQHRHHYFLHSSAHSYLGVRGIAVPWGPGAAVQGKTVKASWAINQDFSPFFLRICGGPQRSDHHWWESDGRSNQSGHWRDSHSRPWTLSLQYRDMPHREGLSKPQSVFGRGTRQLLKPLAVKIEKNTDYDRCNKDQERDKFQ